MKTSDKTEKSPDVNDPVDWKKLLMDAGLEKHIGKFEIEELTNPKVWPTLSKEDLRSMGMKLGSIIKFLEVSSILIVERNPKKIEMEDRTIKMQENMLNACKNHVDNKNKIEENAPEKIEIQTKYAKNDVQEKEKKVEVKDEPAVGGIICEKEKKVEAKDEPEVGGINCEKEKKVKVKDEPEVGGINYERLTRIIRNNKGKKHAFNVKREKDELDLWEEDGEACKAMETFFDSFVTRNTQCESIHIITKHSLTFRLKKEHIGKKENKPNENTRQLGDFVHCLQMLKEKKEQGINLTERWPGQEKVCPPKSKIPSSERYGASKFLKRSYGQRHGGRGRRGRGRRGRSRRGRGRRGRGQRRGRGRGNRRRDNNDNRRGSKRKNERFGRGSSKRQRRQRSESPDYTRCASPSESPPAETFSYF